MTNLSDVTSLPDDFDGLVRLFPLPELVVFPHAMQPLHIFEPRYCSLLAESLAADQLIAMATLVDPMPASKAKSTTFSDQPPVGPYVCICKVISQAVVDGDKHNILLMGAKRARVIQEVATPHLYRMARVEVIEDVYSPSGAGERVEVKSALLRAFGGIIPATASVQQNLHELMSGSMGLGPITDIISFNLPFKATEKLRLLGIANVDQRAKELTEMLTSGDITLHSVSPEEQGAAKLDDTDEGDFPPPFSLN